MFACFTVGNIYAFDCKECVDELHKERDREWSKSDF